MKTVLFGIGLILLSLLCQMSGDFLIFPVPISLVGMGVLLLFIILLRRVPAGLSNVSQLLLGNMALFFVPITLSVFMLESELVQHLWVIFGALFVSTVLSLIITAWVAKKLLSGRKNEH